MYTKGMAIRAHKNQRKATYINVAEYTFFPDKYTDREKAKSDLQEFAKKENLTMSHLFDLFNKGVKDEIRELDLNGYFDF